MSLKPTATVAEFFQEAVTTAMRNQQISAPPEAEFYLVNLLAGYATHPVDDDKPFALELAEASLASPDERVARLREIGDRSLYLSGYFAESLARRAVTVEYCVRVGGSAYGQLAAMPMRSVHASVFRELSSRFGRYVRVVGEVAEQSFLAGQDNVIALWERWRRTRSESIERRLRALGVNPAALAAYAH